MDPAAPTNRPAPDRWFAAAVALVGAIGALGTLVNLATATLLPDERTYVEAGRQYVQGVFSFNREHPPFGKWLFGWAGRLVGDPILGGRLVSVAAGAAIAVGLFVLVRRLAGRWWGIAAAGIWVVVPHVLRAAGQPWGGFDRLDRFAMLDPLAAALAFWAVVAAVVWRGDRRWRWGLVAGVLLGLAAGTKVSGGLLVVAVALAPWLRSPRTPVRRALTESVAVGAISVAVFLLTYAPFGSAAVGALRFMLDFQLGQAANGHDVVLAGRAYAFAPWWIHAWYTWRDDGPVLAVALYVAALAGAVGAPGSRRDRLLVVAAVAVPVVVLSLSPVGLPHYRYLWLPGVVALAALGLAGLARRGRPGQVVVAVLAAGMVVTGVRTLAFTSTLQVSDYRAVAAVLDTRGQAGGRVLVRGFPGLLTSYAPRVSLVERLPAEVVVLDPKVTDLRPVPALRERLRAGPWDAVEVDRLEVWLRRP